MSTGARPSSSAPRSAWFVLALAALVALLYAQTARHEFVGYDDGSYITRNPHVKGGLSLANVRWAFAEFHSANWHPLTWLSHQLDVTLFGLAAGPQHLVNAALHALAAALCFVFLRRATGKAWPSFLVALLFALHPQRVESVAWASERKDVLSGALFFLTLLAHERYARAPSTRRYLALAGSFALGLLAKPMLVTVPVVLLLVDLWPLRRTEPLRALVLEKLPLAALALASCAVTLVAQQTAGAVSTLETLTLAQRLATAVLGTFAYLRQAFWPSGLAFFYPHPALVAPEEFRPFGAAVVLGALALVALSIATWRARARVPALFVGWAWMLVMLLPVIGLVQVGTQFYADRYAYLPLVGLALALVFGADELLPAAAKRGAFALGLAACVAFAAVSWRQIGTWRDDRTLCERALAVTERNDKALQLLGDYYHRRGELASARAQYEAALVLRPDHYQIHSNLGVVLAQLGEGEKARAELNEALRLLPTCEDARMNLGWLCEREQDHAGALEQYAIAAREHPDAPEAWQKLGETLFALLRLSEARDALAHALALDPDSADAEAALGSTLAELGERDAALAHLARALRLAPEHALALHGEAWLRATSPSAPLREPEAARALLARYGERTDLARWLHLRVAAAVLASDGRFQDAARTAAEAGGLAPKAWWPKLDQERKRYAAGSGFGG